MRIRHRRLLPVLCLVSATLGACIAAPPAAPAASAPSIAPTPSAPPAPSLGADVTETPLPPGAVRCGVDDQPIPVGDLLPGPRPVLDLDRRFFAEPPLQLPPAARGLPNEVTLQARGEGLTATDAALTAVFADCDEMASPADTGSLSVRVAFAANGAPRTSAPLLATGTPALSRYGRCLVERACRLPTAPALAGKTGAVHVRTAVVVPVFRGKVEAQVVFGQPPAGMGPPRVTKAQRAKLDAFKAPVEAAALRCARSLPPADDVFLTFQAVTSKGQPAELLMSPSGGHAEVIRACLDTELRGKLPGTAAETTVTISVQIVAGANLPLDSKASPDARPLGGDRACRP